MTWGCRSMPNRILREGILTSERVNVLSWEEEVFYRRLMSVVDDFGRFSAHPALLRAALYPLKLDTVRDANLERLLAAVEQARLVRVYEVAGKRYVEMLDFRQHARAKESRYPQPPPSACSADAQQMQSTCTASAPVFGFGGEDGGEDGGASRAGGRVGEEGPGPAETRVEPPPLPATNGHERPLTPAAEVGMAMRRAGLDLTRVNTSDPRVAEMLRKGATPEEFEGLAREAMTKQVRDPWQWVLAVLPKRRADAGAISLAPKASTTVTENPQVAATQNYLDADREHRKQAWKDAQERIAKREGRAA